VRGTLGISKKQFRDAIHRIKTPIQGNPDVAFDPVTGDVFDQRSGKWIGNLLDDVF
jgi:hypothetical protein